MNQLPSSLKRKLSQYSLLVSPALVTAGVANAQIVYHNIDPDILYQDSVSGDNYTNPVFLDLDGNGVFDVEFAAWSSMQSKNGPNVVNLAGARQFGEPGNGILGYTHLFSATFCSTPLTQFCPSVLEPEMMIGPSEDFWAVPNPSSVGTLVRFFKDKDNFIGQWNNLTDKFMGLRFKMDDGAVHYAWIRMDVFKNPSSITLKDYAYESQGNVAINAGDMGDVGISPAIVSQTFAIHNSEGTVTVSVNDGDISNAIINVISISGQTILTQPVTNKNTEINMNGFPKGIYMIVIRRANKSFSKQILLQ